MSPWIIEGGDDWRKQLREHIEGFPEQAERVFFEGPDASGQWATMVPVRCVILAIGLDQKLAKSFIAYEPNEHGPAEAGADFNYRPVAPRGTPH